MLLFLVAGNDGIREPNKYELRFLPSNNKFNRYLRKTFEEDSDVRRKRDALQSLLKGSARKQANIETKRDGLYK